MGRNNDIETRVRRVIDLMHSCFAGVVLEDGIGLREAEALSLYEPIDAVMRARAADLRIPWEDLPASELNVCNTPSIFLDKRGFTFYLPAYIVTGLASGWRTPGPEQHHWVALEALEIAVRYGRLPNFSKPQWGAIKQFLLLLEELAPDLTISDPCSAGEFVALRQLVSAKLH